MNHIDKYVCTVVPNLLFKGENTPTMGTRFHCKACEQYAFQIRGESHGEAVRNSLKKRHAEHVQQKCQPHAAERMPKPTPSTEDNGVVTAVELEPSAIATWRARDVQDWMIVHCSLPAPIKTYDFLGFWNPDTNAMSNGAGTVCVTFENEFGRSHLLKMPVSILTMGTQRPQELEDEWKAFKYEEMVDAKVKSLVKRLIWNVLDNARCGHKQSLHDRFQVLYRDDPAALEDALRTAEHQQLAKRARSTSPSKQTYGEGDRRLFAPLGSRKPRPVLRLVTSKLVP